MTTEETPTPFETEYPEEAKILMDIYAQPASPVRIPRAPGRNEPCPCGSQKKHKKCCG